MDNLIADLLLARDCAGLLGAARTAVVAALPGSCPEARLSVLHPSEPGGVLNQTLVGGLVSPLRLDPATIAAAFPPEPVAEHGRDKVAVVLPLRNEAKLVGAMRFRIDGGITPESFRSAGPRLAEICEAASKALPNCLDAEFLRSDRYFLLEVLYAVSQLQSLSDPSTTAEAAVRVAREHLHLDRCLVAVHDGDRGCMRIEAQSGFHEASFQGEFSVVGDDDSYIGRVVRRAEAIWERERSRPVFPVPMRSTPEQAGANAFAAPLMVGGRAMGVFYGDYTENRGQINEERFLALRMFANTIGNKLESAKLMRELQSMAAEDGLTGLANRRTLSRVLEGEVARAKRKGTPLSLLIMDIDRFKLCNDIHGHPYGDRVIRATADLLREATRQTDLVARYGGDEFVVLMPDSDEGHAKLVEDRIRFAVRKMAPHLDGDRWNYNLSIGRRTVAGSDADRLLEYADAALYTQKEERIRASILGAVLTAQHGMLPAGADSLSWLLGVLGEKEPAYLRHSRRVLDLCVRTARRMGWEKRETDMLALAALFHDVGKISVPTELLAKPGPLTEEEAAVVREHVRIGREFLIQIPAMAPVADIVASHHERWDGRRDGTHPAYPGDLRGDEIPRGARLLKIADTWDALVHGRPYSEPRSHESAAKLLHREAGSSLDPAMVPVFLEVAFEPSSGVDATGLPL